MVHDLVIIGGGIVGLSTAYQLKKLKPQLQITVVEKENRIAKHQTGHNSGVIHSGLYYKPHSLKAINCINGYQMLLDFCKQEGIAYELCGKLVVATNDGECQTLDMLYKRGIANGLSKIKKIAAEQIPMYEPYCRGLAAIFVPYTGIIDYIAVASKYAEIFTHRLQGEIITNTKVIDISRSSNFSELITTTGNYQTKLVINCAGLYADVLANRQTPKLPLRIIPFRGEYYKLKPTKQHLVKHLIYPVPDPAFPFLGVHFTRMICGGIAVGPNAVFAFKREGYSKTAVNFKELAASIAWPGFQKAAIKYWKIGLVEFYRSFSKKAFTKALQKLVPDIQAQDIVAAPAGVRAQTCDKKGNLIDDFVILEQDNMIHVCNTPSPAATASLAIGATIAKKALAYF